MKELIINNKKCYLYEDDSKDCFIMPVDDHDLSLLDNLIKLSRNDNLHFNLLAIKIENWDNELSPWKSEPLFKGNNFTGEADNLIEYIKNDLIVNLDYKNYYLIGYSLAGLFALCCGYHLDIFKGIGTISGSLWYKNWLEYIKNNKILCDNVYLSLGDKEANSKNQIMSTVLDNTNKTYEILKENCNCFMELNPGNHFVDFEIRIYKAIKWLLNE